MVGMSIASVFSFMAATLFTHPIFKERMSQVATTGLAGEK